jgi:multiple sugar transport system substrate-binding protein
MKRKSYGKAWVMWVSALLLGFGWSIQAYPQSINLELWIAEARPAYKKILLEASESFSKQHPQIKINVVQMLAGDVLVKWPAAAAAQTLPDISWGFAHYIPWLHDMAGGGLLPLDDIANELGGTQKIDLLKEWRYKGNLRGIPVWRLPVWLSYRADLFAKAGLKPPQKWTDVLEAAKKLNDPANKIYGISMSGAKIWDTRMAFECVLYGYGGQSMNKECKPVYNTAETVAAMKLFTDLFKYAPPGAVGWDYMPPIRAFSMGSTAMFIGFGTVLDTVAKSSPNLAKDIRVTLPYEKVPDVTHVSSRGWTIFSTTKYPKESKMFVKHLFNPKTVGDFCNTVPLALAPAYLHPEVYQRVRNSDTAKMFSSEVVERILSPIRGYTAGIGECGPNPWSGVMNGQKIFEEGINNVLTQGWTAEKAVAWTQSEMEKIMGK